MDNDKSFYKICSELNKILKNKENPRGYVLRAIKAKCCDLGISEDGIKELKQIYDDNKFDIDKFLIAVIKIGIDEGVLDINEVFNLRQKIEELEEEEEIAKEPPAKAQKELPQSSKKEQLADKDEEEPIEEELTEGEEKQKIARKRIEEFNKTGRIKAPVKLELSPIRTREKEEQPPSPKTMLISTVQDIKSKSLEEDLQKYAFIQHLCMYGITLSEISIDNIPVPFIKPGAGYPELCKTLNSLKVKLNDVLSISNSKLVYSEDVKRVIKWTLGEDSGLEEIKKKERIVENYLNRSGIGSSRNFIRIMNDCFKNVRNDEIDNCTMVYIIERLKRKNRQIIEDNPFYNGYKANAKRNIGSILREAYTNNKNKEEEIR